MKRIWRLSLAVGWIGCCALARGEESMKSVHDFTMTDIDGRSERLGDARMACGSPLLDYLARCRADPETAAVLPSRRHAHSPVASASKSRSRPVRRAQRRLY